MSRGALGAAAGLLVLLGSVSAFAQGTGGARCMLGATPLVFGRYLPFSGVPADFSATLTLTCTASGAAPVAFHGTIALSGGASARHLASGVYKLRYQLYLDPGRRVLWGNGIGGTVSVSGVVSANAVFRQTITVYGRILARQSGARVGVYTDRIMIEMNY